MNGPGANRSRLRIGVYNRFWPTAGGGEKFAGGVAQALAADHDVELLGHDDTDPASLAVLAERLQLDLRGVGWRAVGLDERDIEAASADYDLFINVSYGSTVRNRARRGLYIVHFPTGGAPPHTGWRRFLLRATGKLAALARLDLETTRWIGGMYTAEPLGPLTHRWTDGEGVLQTHPTRQLTVVLCRATAAGRGPVTVEARDAEDRLLAATTVRARSWTRIPVTVLRVPVPAADGTSTVRLVSATRPPDAHGGDPRRLGASVLAVAGGPWHQQLLQLVAQPLLATVADPSFLEGYQVVAANSAFTAEWTRRLWAVKPVILNPPISAQPRGTKEPIILHVGRFFPPSAGHSKRQVEMVEAFGRLVAAGAAPGWTLHLAGGCDDQGRGYLEQVRAAIGDLPVELHVNCPASELRDLFARASIYWHATGLGEDPDAHPDRMEHFGIATVEAMSAGAVPVVIGVAGQLEVVDNGIEGYHFADLDELVARTSALVADPEQRRIMSDAAVARAARYGEDAFKARLSQLVEELRR